MDFHSKDVNDIFANLDKKVGIVFRHQMLMSVYQSIPRDYDLGFFMSEVEIHALGFIQKEPGMTAKRLGQLTYRTKGTISSMLSHLEKEGFLEQRINPENMRERRLYLTSKGEFVCEQHDAFDRRTTYNYLMEAAKHCTLEEINGFFKVTHYRSEYFEKVIEEEKAKYSASQKKAKQSDD
ncbi:MarR family transcriptional regulator [Clostridium sp. P21]|uniref:MarR family transcriptional regulator n=1 Tax=Clostridium muellerianum TaxID=2716538 RepID=A0A7Y0EH73_9CLOT|nr:MarR family transcriptional regulator [Clostridium muellerianum]NMM63383.1 MarR family transcriptional regulator [Clostridium muellerianum]